MSDNKASDYYMDENGRIRQLSEKRMVRMPELKKDGRVKWSVLRKCKGGKGVCK